MIGGAALGIRMDVDAAGLDDFNAWYRARHLPERLAVPALLRGHRRGPWRPPEFIYSSRPAGR